MSPKLKNFLKNCTFSLFSAKFRHFSHEKIKICRDCRGRFAPSQRHPCGVLNTLQYLLYQIISQKNSKFTSVNKKFSNYLFFKSNFQLPITK